MILIKMIFFCIFLLSIVAVADSKTSIRYEKIPENLSTGIDKFKCKGKFSIAGLFEDIGYSDVDLEKGVPCRQADFDSNRVNDYWIYKCAQGASSCKSKVILMKKTDILKPISLSPILEAPDVFYFNNKKDHEYLEKFGCRLPKIDSLIKLGDGEGLMTKIYSLNKERTDFTEVSSCETQESLVH